MWYDPLSHSQVTHGAVNQSTSLSFVQLNCCDQIKGACVLVVSSAIAVAKMQLALMSSAQYDLYIAGIFQPSHLP